MHGVGLVPAVGDVVEDVAHAGVLGALLGRAEVVVHHFVHDAVRNSAAAVGNPAREETKALPRSGGGAAATLEDTFRTQPATHLMTKSKSLLAMVTITSGTLYGVLRWLSMVALKAPHTKRCVCGAGQ